jgi:hypothetical protein
MIRRALLALGVAVAALAGLALVALGCLYAATATGGGSAPPADRRLGDVLVLAGTAVALAGPVALVRRHRWYALVVVAVAAVVTYWVHDWPPTIDWTF